MNNYPLIMLSELVVFPKMIFSIQLETSKSIENINYAVQNNTDIFLIYKPALAEPNEAERIGVIAKVVQVVKIPDGKAKVLLEALDRAKAVSLPIIEGDVALICAEIDNIKYEITPKLEALKRSVIKVLYEYNEITENIKVETIDELDESSDYQVIGNSIFNNLSLSPAEKQKLLVMNNMEELLSAALQYMQHELEVCSAEKSIQSTIQEQITKNNREYFLKEQLKLIQKELGSAADDIEQKDIKELEEKGKNKKFSKEARERFDNELKKLKMMSPISSESSVTRTYLEWLLDLPWEEKSILNKDLKKAREILDRDHFGLEKVKNRILEYLAVQSRTDKIKDQILCLFGPPGVGKTSLAKSIAEATGRTYVKISLGGVRDEAEIRGHRRTYISALPGKIISAMKKAKVANPLILLDEIDKLGSDSRGDPEAALLEVLDPEQNKEFSDHYLEIDYDLSDIMFIATANTLEMSKPLLDRLEIIRLSGYTEFEKFEISQKYLIPKVLFNNGLHDNELNITDDVVWKLIRDYTRESGVRNLYRELSGLARKVIREITENSDIKNVEITLDNLVKYAGIQKYIRDPLEEQNLVGITTGLAWTEVGGETLSIEAAMFPGKGKVTLTGKLGNVMQESIQAAMSLVRSRASILGISPEVFEKNDFHIHVPDGATPKDGPSAGIAMVTSIVSVITNKPVKKEVAMTGEITLRGRVLPIGGLKEKILAAHRAFIKTIIIPRDNEKDLKEIPADILNSLNIKLAVDIDDVLSEALSEI